MECKSVLYRGNIRNRYRLLLIVAEPDAINSGSPDDSEFSSLDFETFIRQWISTNNGPFECGSILTTYLASSAVTGVSITSEARKISPKLPLPTKQ